MKTFSIRTLLILIAVCGFACWYFLIPVDVSVRMNPDQWLWCSLCFQEGDLEGVTVPVYFEGIDIRADLVRWDSGTDVITVRTSRLDSMSLSGEIQYSLDVTKSTIYLKNRPRR